MTSLASNFLDSGFSTFWICERILPVPKELVSTVTIKGWEFSVKSGWPSKGYFFNLAWRSSNSSWHSLGQLITPSDFKRPRIFWLRAAKLRKNLQKNKKAGSEWLWFCLKFLVKANCPKRPCGHYRVEFPFNVPNPISHLAGLTLRPNFSICVRKRSSFLLRSGKEVAPLMQWSKYKRIELARSGSDANIFFSIKVTTWWKAWGAEVSPKLIWLN